MRQGNLESGARKSPTKKVLRNDVVSIVCHSLLPRVLLAAALHVEKRRLRSSVPSSVRSSTPSPMSQDSATLGISATVLHSTWQDGGGIRKIAHHISSIYIDWEPTYVYLWDM